MNCFRTSILSLTLIAVGHPVALAWAQSNESAPRSALAKHIDNFLTAPNSIIVRARRARELGEQFEPAMANQDVERAQEILQELETLKLHEIRLHDVIDDMQNRIRRLEKRLAEEKSDAYIAEVKRLLRNPDAKLEALQDAQAKWPEIEQVERQFGRHAESVALNAALHAWINVRTAVEAKNRTLAINALQELKSRRANSIPKDIVEQAFDLVNEMAHPIDTVIEDVHSPSDFKLALSKLQNLHPMDRHSGANLTMRLRALDEIHQALELGQGSKALSSISAFRYESSYPRVTSIYESMRISAYKLVLSDYGIKPNIDEDSTAYAKRVLKSLVETKDIDSVHDALKKLLPSGRANRNDLRWIQFELEQARGLIVARNSEDASDLVRAVTHYRRTLESNSPSQIGLAAIASERLKSLLNSHPNLGGAEQELAKQLEDLRRQLSEMKRQLHTARQIAPRSKTGRVQAPPIRP